MALGKITKGDKIIDASTYIPEYYFAISVGDLEKAKLYMNIVFSLEKIGGFVADREFFRQTFEEEEKQITSKETKKLTKSEKNKLIKKYKEEMLDAAKNLQFERAAELRDIISDLEKN